MNGAPARVGSLFCVIPRLKIKPGEEQMGRLQKDEILERLVFSEGVFGAYSRPETRDSEPGCDHWSGPVLLERAAYLRKLARFGEGSASETIREFPAYSILLAVLLRSGDAVVHEQHGNTFMVLDGRATLLMGGELERTRRVAESEVRGAAITGGSSTELRGGEVVHIASGTPYQFLLAGDQALSCLVVRVREIAESQ
jgi:hypothetical protein